MVKKALITGICGQIGSYIADYLLVKGYEVYGLDRRVASEKQDERYSRIKHIKDEINIVYGDIRDYPTIYNLIKEIKPNEIYHFAAQSHVGISFKDPFTIVNGNILGTLNILEVIKNIDKNIRYVHASSSEQFGKVLEMPQTEKTPFNPQSPYAVGKVACHEMGKVYRKAYNMFCANTILFNSESPRRGDNFVTRKITRAVAKIYLGIQDKLYLGNLEAKRDWGHVKDKVKGIYRTIQHTKPDDFVLATGETHTVRQFCKLAFDCFDLDYKNYVEIDPKFYRPAEVDVLVGDYSKAKENLRWKPTISFKKMVHEMVTNDYLELIGDK